MNIAEQFPLSDVEEIIRENYIAIAQPNMGDHAMYVLFTLWKMHIEPTIEANCNLCLNRVLRNYRGLQEYMVERLKNNNLLDAVY